jgi:Ion channel
VAGPRNARRGCGRETAAGPVNDSAPGEISVPYRRIGATVLRVAATTVIVVTAYYLLPFDRAATWGAVTMLVAGLVALIALIGFQVRTIVRSRFPNLRAIEALATSLPLFLLLFAGTYYVMERLSPGSFGTRLSRTDAMYFTVTVFTTVGFGDITAKTETARLVVTGQMIADLLVLGLGVKIILGAVRRGQQRRRERQDADGEPG